VGQCDASLDADRVGADGDNVVQTRRADENVAHGRRTARERGLRTNRQHGRRHSQCVGNVGFARGHDEAARVSARKVGGILEERSEDVRITRNYGAARLAPWTARVNRPARHAYGCFAPDARALISRYWNSSPSKYCFT